MPDSVHLVAHFDASANDRKRALRAGFDAVAPAMPEAATIANLPEALRALSRGERILQFAAPFDASGAPTESWRAARLLSPFLRAFGQILESGKLTRNLSSVRGGLVAHETHTAQLGSILWIENPEIDRAVTGSVFPVLPEITLPANAVFAYIHDAPLGVGAKYLGAYAGLVKSDAAVLTAEILPDPFHGIRLYVYGEPGETREVALWTGNDRGRGVDITFTDTPRVYTAGMSQIVTLPSALASLVWMPPDDPTAPILIGPTDVREHAAHSAIVVLPSIDAPIFVLQPDGTITEAQRTAHADNISSETWTEIDDIAVAATGAGQYRATITVPESGAGDAEIDIHIDASASVFLNGERTRLVSEDTSRQSFDLRLRPGENEIVVSIPEGGRGLRGPVFLVPNGGCYLIDITRWRYRPTAFTTPSYVHLTF